MYFHLGPLGDLRALPPIESDATVDASAAGPFAEHVSLYGSRTIDRLGPRRRTWALQWSYLVATEIDELGALAGGLLGGPLWVVDPSRPNLLPTQVATAGTERRSADGWTVVNGSRTWVRLTARPPGVQSIGAIAWSRATITDVLSVGRTTVRQRVPLRAGDTTVSVAASLARVSSVAVAVAIGIDAWDADGDLTTSFATPVTVGSNWSVLTHSWTVPAGTVSFAPVWSIAAGQPTSTVLVAGVRAGYGATPPAASSGGGVARVYVPGDGFTETEVSEGDWNAAMKLVET